MLEYEVPADVIDSAKAKSEAADFKKANLVDNDGTAGFIAEWAFQQFRPTARHDDTRDYDFFSKDKRIDVKAKKINCVPRPHHKHNIHDRQRKNQCDIYVFAAVKKDFSRVWLMGWATKEEFFDQLATFHEKGETQPRDDGSEFVFLCPTWNVEYSKLRGLR